MNLLCGPFTILAVLLHVHSTFNAQPGPSRLGCDITFSTPALVADYTLCYKDQHRKASADEGRNHHANINSMDVNVGAATTALPFYAFAVETIHAQSSDLNTLAQSELLTRHLPLKSS